MSWWTGPCSESSPTIPRRLEGPSLQRSPHPRKAGAPEKMQKHFVTKIQDPQTHASKTAIDTTNVTLVHFSASFVEISRHRWKQRFWDLYIGTLQGICHFTAAGLSHQGAQSDVHPDLHPKNLWNDQNCTLTQAEASIRVKWSLAQNIDIVFQDLQLLITLTTDHPCHLNLPPTLPDSTRLLLRWLWWRNSHVKWWRMALVVFAFQFLQNKKPFAFTLQET